MPKIRVRDALGEPLTPRELQVLQMLADDSREKMAAEKLECSVDTVNIHKQRIFRKLGVRTAQGAVAVGFRRGWLR